MKAIVAVLLVAAVGAGCTTTTGNGEVRAGVDLLSLPSYQVRAWVPQTPVVRQICAAADWYGYAWQNTPWQMVTAHLGILAAGEERGWWDMVDGLGDDGDAAKPPALPAIPGTTFRVRVDGNGNAIAYQYDKDAPIIDIDVKGDNNGVAIEPKPDEEEEDGE